MREASWVRLRRDQLNHGKIGGIAGRIARQDRVAAHGSMRAYEEIGEHLLARSAGAAIYPERLCRCKSRLERQALSPKLVLRQKGIDLVDRVIADGELRIDDLVD